MSRSTVTQGADAATAAGKSTSHGPLSGVRVLDLSWLIPGPFCTTMLAEMGADVIKIERPAGGDYMRHDRKAEFEVVNRGKRALVLNLKEPEARDIFLKLAEQADVVVESFRPGVVERLGIGYGAVSERNAGIIYLSLSGYGQEGPYRDHPGHDINYLALTGALSIPGRWGDEPQRSGLPMGDMSAGLYGVISILAALRQRDATGKGQHLDVAISDAMLHWTQLRLADNWASLAKNPQHTSTWVHLDPGNDVFATADGRKVAVALVEEKFINVFRQVTNSDQPELNAIFAAESRCTPDGAERFRATVGQLIAKKTLAEWKQIYNQHGIPLTPVATPAEVRSDEHFAQRGMLVSAPDAGQNPTVYVPLPGTATPGGGGAPSPAPAPGQHSHEILATLGISDEAIRSLKERGIVD